MFVFKATTLEAAIRATFKRRRTELPLTAPVALTEAFAREPTKIQQWQAFVKRWRFKLLAPEWAVVIPAVRNFLVPLIEAAPVGQKMPDHWPKGGPWRAAK